MTPSSLFPITEQSQIGEMRRKVASISDDIGFDAVLAGKISIIVTEMATNILKHADQGQIIVSPITQAGINGIELLALDKGPGMADIGRCFEDGYSTAGSQGTGLGAITRQSQEFDIYSQPGNGTVILARLWAAPVPPTEMMEIGAINIPFPGETRCGDAWAMLVQDGEYKIMVVDGLGHGLMASEAAMLACAMFQDNPRASPLEMVQIAHDGLRATRGAAMAVIHFIPEKNLARFAGAGNIAGNIIENTTSRGLASYNGIVGHQMVKLQEMTYPMADQALLVMHSDGIATRWNIASYPGLKMRHPSVIAGILYRDFQRGHDDATVLVARLKEEKAVQKWV
ncbi:MAG: Stage sporulation protein [Alphaproteobacteria bacterium]|nr:Stage sporulation protein [Alphaproteobacteria bacterium]